MNKTIVVAGIEDNTAKGHIIILENTGETYRNGDKKVSKYKIWVKDNRTGQPSEPYTQFQNIRPMIGDTLNLDVWEKEDSFTNEQGKLINFTSRTINRFLSDAPQSPATHVSPKSNTNTPPVDIEALRGDIKAGFQKRDSRIEELEKQVEELMGRLNVLEETVDTIKMKQDGAAMADALGIK